ncbi:MAG: cytochrome P450 [Anderseniella sp.]
MNTDFCTQLYEFARSDPGRDVWIEVAGEPVLLVQSLASAQQVLATNASSFTKTMKAMSQVCGPSRLTENGDDWRYLYRISQPLLSNVDAKNLVRAVNKHALISVEQLLLGAQTGANEANQATLLEMTASIMSEVLFNRSIADFGPGFLEDLAMFFRFIGLNFKPPYSGDAGSAADPRWMHELGDLRLRWIKRIANIKPTVRPKDRLLHRLSRMDAGKAAIGGFEYEVLMLFGAGSDTTAATISWAILLLAQYPDTQQKLRRELEQYWVTDTPDSSEILKNDMLLRFLSEVFRLYPVGPFFGRRARTRVKVGEHQVDDGVQVIVSSVGLGRNPNSFANPDALELFRDPDTRCPNEATVPFSAGPRRCGGQRIAMIELPIILAIFLHHLKFDLQHPATITFDWQVTMHCHGGVPVKISRIPKTLKG